MGYRFCQKNSPKGRRISKVHFLLAITVAIFSGRASQAELSVPNIESGRFDANGKLLVTVSSPPPAGCSLALWGGLSSTSVDTLITAKKLTDAEIALGTVSIRTRRRYYCKRRTLYVRVISECYPAAAPSKVVKVSVPTANIQR